MRLLSFASLLLLFGCPPAAEDKDETETETQDDNDEDGFAEGQDCDDDNEDVNPEADEKCDEIDNNCNGEVDEGLSSTWYEDADEDGYGDASKREEACDAPGNSVADSSDCDDRDANINPAARDNTCDGVDNNCDDSIDEGAAFSDYYPDADNDGFGDESGDSGDSEVDGSRVWGRWSFGVAEDPSQGEGADRGHTSPLEWASGTRRCVSLGGAHLLCAHGGRSSDERGVGAHGLAAPSQERAERANAPERA